MKNIFAYIIVLLMSCFCFSCRQEKPHEYEELSNLDFGIKSYPQEPIKGISKYPPFSWCASKPVKVNSELEIEFNEDAIRSQSSGQILFVDENGNRVNGMVLGNSPYSSFSVTAKGGKQVIPIEYTLDPAVGDSILTGSIMIVSNGIDKVNHINLTPTATPIGAWTMHHKLGVNWWQLMLLVAILLALLFIFIYIISAAIKLLSSFRIMSVSALPKHIFRNKLTNRSEELYEEEDEDEYGHGHYENSSTYIIHDNYIIPNGNQHKNPYGKTNIQFLRELNDRIGIIKVLNGEPIFDKDGGTKNGKPLQIMFPEGIKGYLSEYDITKKKNIRRTKLHNEAYRRIAKKYAIEEDELQIFKGNSEPLERLMQKWNCSEDDVYLRCHNPYRINRVLHECKDGKTIQLVPWVYHHIKHDGGISEITSRY